MNAKKTQTYGQFVELPVADIVPSGNNPRIINEKDAGFAELAESIKAQGVIVPVHVRRHPAQKNKYELLAGERRLLASAKVERDTIIAIDHGDIGDDEAFNITFIENFGREDLTPLEQGKAVVILLTKYKNDAQAVASKMGKSVRWVMQRAAIDKNLSERWKKASSEDSSLANMTASHFGPIAALPVEVQDEIFEDYIDMGEWCYGEVPTVAELEKIIAEMLRLLSKAPWDLDDAKLLDKVKACSKCSKRSSHQPGLFDDTTDLEVVKKNDRCLDQNCWERKAAAYLDLRAAELKNKYHNLVFAVMPDINYSEKSKLILKYDNIASQWKASKEGAKDALPALMVHGKNAGELRWIKFVEITGTDTQGKSRKIGSDGKRKPTPLRDRRLMLNSKRWAQVLRELCEKVEDSGVELIIYEPNTYVVAILAGIFGTIENQQHLYPGCGDWKDFQKSIDKELASASGGIMGQTFETLWGQVRAVLVSRLTYGGPISQTPPEYIDEAKNVSKLLGIDVEAMFKKVAEQDYPEPKSWKGLNADGTPKTAKPKKANAFIAIVRPKKAKSEKKKLVEVQTCRVCGCTDDKPCVFSPGKGTCHWVKKDLCSACVKEKKNGKS